MRDICLIAMPFGSIHRPSLGLSLLKSELARIGISSRIHYFNMKFAERIPLELYEKLAESSLDSPLVGELIFSIFVSGKSFSPKREISGIVKSIFASKHYNIHTIDELVNEIFSLRSLVPDFLDDCLYNIMREKPKLVGFSSTFEQNCSSLALAKILKDTLGIPIIFGGANCEGVMGWTLLKLGPWIDFVCSGEGDIAFIELAKNLLEGNLPSKINGIITRESSPLDMELTSPVVNMDLIPFPDFDDYFAAWESSIRVGRQMEPELAIETSRGCWWGEKFQCTFCGLNGSTMKFRCKSVTRVLEELTYLSEKYNIERFQVVDNIMDLKYIDNLFPEISKRGLNVTLFYETKSNLSKAQLALMKRGGVDAVQPGIESFNDNVLKTMRKGVTALQNIQTLKWCRELNISPLWNLIWGFPGESKEEYDEIERLIPLLMHLHPPSGFGRISLDRFSPYFVEPSRSGILNIRPWVAYKYVYPTLSDKDLHNVAYHFDFDYNDGRDPGTYTRGLERELIHWKELWNNTVNKRPPALNIIRGKSTIKIDDTRPCSAEKLHTLMGLELEVYEICRTAHTFQTILPRTKGVDEHEIGGAVTYLVEKKIMIHHNGRYLSLATHQDRFD